MTRIDVHAGPVLVGNFGGGHFFDYTAYGDTIITAARLEAANKQLGTRICVSAAIAEGARAFRGRPVGGLMLRGRGNPLRAFNPLSNDDAEQSWLKKYDAAFAQLEAGDPAAMSAFSSHMGAHSEAP